MNLNTDSTRAEIGKLQTEIGNTFLVFAVLLLVALFFITASAAAVMYHFWLALIPCAPLALLCGVLCGFSVRELKRQGCRHVELEMKEAAEAREKGRAPARN